MLIPAVKSLITSTPATTEIYTLSLHDALPIFFGGRSSTYEGELIQARQNALREMEERALEIGANAVVGVDIDYEVLGSNNGMLMVTASGTAVVTD